jgi:hypothetical protein
VPRVRANRRFSGTYPRGRAHSGDWDALGTHRLAQLGRQGLGGRPFSVERPASTPVAHCVTERGISQAQAVGVWTAACIPRMLGEVFRSVVVRPHGVFHLTATCDLLDPEVASTSTP